MILTNEERDKFAAWCRQDAASNKALIEQMEKLGTSLNPILRQKRAEVAAVEFVAGLLERTATETVTV